MTDEQNTSPEGETLDVQPAQADTAPDWDYYDPDEDNVESPDPAATEDDGEPAEADPEDEGADEEAEADEAEEAEETPEIAETIELPDGTKVSSEEVVKGYLRQADYTRKTSEVAQLRKTLDAETTRINGITEAFIDHLSKLIPAAPGQDLAYRDPNAYTRQRAAHEAAVKQVEELVKLGEQAKETQSTLSAEDQRRLAVEENQKLVQRFPEVAKPEARRSFMEGAAAAAEAAGFTMDELQGVTDHRVFALAHWANLGMKAQQAKAKATRKAASAPPATPNRPAQNKRPNRNREAMSKLSKTGSIRDALRVDWE